MFSRSKFMFDFDISLFMLNMCNTIIRHFDCICLYWASMYSHIHVIVKFTCLKD